MNQQFKMDQSLYHYGVPGMKWGIRKAPVRSSSGSRRSGLFAKKKKPVAKQQVQKPKKKSIKDMTSDELNEKIKRLELEKKYMDAKKDADPQARGKKFVIDVLEQIGKNTLTNLGTQAANKLVGELINKVAKVDSSDTQRRIVNPQKGQSDKK